MIKRITITKELRDYIEMLNYEATRYKDLLLTVNRDCCPMTDEEWASSQEYYQNLSTEAQYALQVAKNTVAEMYADEIAGQCWHINFIDCALVIGSQASEPLTIRHEQYSEHLRRLFVPEKREPIAINSPHVKDITLQVTEACNMACTYCYQHSKSNNSMTFEVAKEIIDMILDADERTNTYITSTTSIGAVLSFIGGEPWLEIELISKVSDYFIGELFRRKHPWAIKFMFHVCSNGLLHFDPKVQAYIKRHRNHFGYNISIDGDKDLHDACRVDVGGNGTYDRAIAAVQDYRETFDGDIGSKMTIAPGNVDKIFRSVSYMIEGSGYRNINLNCVHEEGWTIDHAKTLYWELHKLTDWLLEKGLLNTVRLSIFTETCGQPLDEKSNRNWCGGVGLMLAADYKGNMYPCIRYMETSASKEHPPYIIGNLASGINREQGHCDRVSCLACITRRSQSTDECFNCPIASGCSWCSGYNYELFGTPNKRATFICVMHKARVLANVYYWRLRGKEYAMNCPQDWAVEIIGETEFTKLNEMEVATGGNTDNC